MATLNLKPTDTIVKDYYKELSQFELIGETHEGAVRSAFQYLLRGCAQQFKWTLVLEHSISIRRNKRIVVDGALMDDFRLTHGYWEAKDMEDNLAAAVKSKFEAGYPRDNILFQNPQRAILWQNEQQVLDVDLTDKTRLIEVLETFFAHRPKEYAEWEEAVEKFKDQVPTLGKGLAERLQEEREVNQEFAAAFAAFYAICCQSINPNLSEAAVEEMLIQHLLTRRIFRTVFNNPDFIRRNIIGIEIEKVIAALTEQSFSPDAFLKKLDPFYRAIERAAATRYDFSEKQGFLNTVYEQFFQGFSVKIADTHGVVYTPQPIVDFIVRSVEKILHTEFNRSLSDSGVHIIDPFVGTGNFIVRMMREIRPIALEDKYATELHCNEVLLLPYYIASLNIEHLFDAMTGHYQPFEGICFVDTFETAEHRQLDLFPPENTERVAKQKETPMFVIIGNPPYNAGQTNENDNNKNRKYEVMDKRVKDTYADDSKATLKRKLYDPYVKAIRWASDRIGQEGVVAFVTNNSFIGEKTFDGMRKHLSDDFDTIYILDLGGNARRGLKVSDANVFGITVGVSINFFIKRCNNPKSKAEIFYARVDESWHKEDTFEHLNSKQHYRNIEWKPITPDPRYTWLTEGLRAEFETFIPMGTKEAKAQHRKKKYSIFANVIFRTYSLGVSTNRDWWTYNFNRNALTENISRMIDTYNGEVDRWQCRENWDAKVDDFVDNDDKKIKWSEGLKKKLENKQIAEFAEAKIRRSLYRPFTKSNLYFDSMMNDRVLLFPSIFPTPETEIENRVIIVSDHGSRADFSALMANLIPDLHTLAARDGFQCFPFYIYNKRGKNRRENITEWALKNFRAHYQDETITKWDIFHYIYALLHHPDYRERYEANLKRDLPHLPFAPDFWGFAKAGQRLGEIHIGYEEMPEYQLAFIENREVPLDWRVEKMKLSKDKTQLVYNDFLTLDRIPAKALQYRLGNRSALEWVINQYCVKIDDRSDIANDPNREDDSQYIVKLIGKVITVSLETVEIVEGLPALEV